MKEFLPGVDTPTHVVWLRNQSGRPGAYSVIAADSDAALKIAGKHFDLPIIGVEDYSARRHGVLLLPAIPQVTRPRGAEVGP